MTPILEVVGVAKTFAQANGPDVVALDATDLTVRNGEFVALLGPSGCGKSTLFNMVAGLLEPSRGQIRINGNNVTGEAGHVGYMLQKDLLLPWKNILDNVLLGSKLLRVDDRNSADEARELMGRFGLGGFERSWPSSLSGGMRQRAAVLRTLLSGQEILLLDEPFGALDAMTRASMQSWLLELWSQFNRTVVFVTHDIDEALVLADRVAVMCPRPGRIVKEIIVDLPRPRRTDDEATAPQRARMRHEILEVIRAGAA